MDAPAGLPTLFGARFHTFGWLIAPGHGVGTVHTLEVGENHVTVERVPVVVAGVRDDGVSDRLLVLTVEVGTASRTLLRVDHALTVPAALHLTVPRQDRAPRRLTCVPSCTRGGG